MISVMWKVWKAIAIKPDMCECVFTPLYTFRGSVEMKE